MTEILKCCECGHEMMSREAFVDGKPISPISARAMLMSREWIDAVCRACFEQAETDAMEAASGAILQEED